MRIRLASLIVAVLALAALLVASPAEAATFTYPSGACPVGSMGLNDCIAGASDGDHITVKPGFYHENNTVIGHAVTVSGPCKGKPATLDVAGFMGSALDVQHNDVTIKCMTLQNGNERAISNLTPSNNLHVVKVKATHFAYGIFTEGGAGLVVKNSTFATMSQDAINGDAPSTTALISGNTIKGVSGFCVILNGATTSTISKNNIGPCGNNGIYIQGGAGDTIKGNNVHTVNNNGLAISSDTTTISGNTVNGSSTDGFYSDGVGNTLTGNKVIGAADGSGFELANATTVSNNSVTKGTKFDAFICDPCNGVVISGNTVSGRAGSDAINAVGDGTKITGNTIKAGAHGNGIQVSGDTPVVTNNKVSGGFGNPGIEVSCTGACGAASISSNTESGSTDDFGISVTTSGCGAFPCTTIANNTAGANLEAGLFLNVAFADIKNNKASGSGWGGGGCSSGFDVIAPFNTLTGNTSSGNACDGFRIDDGSNTLSKNTATKNGQMGFHVVSGAGSTLDKNVAKNNTGDGFNNDATATGFTNNKASGNRQDCTNDATTELATTTGPLTSNSCADGSNFAVDSAVNDTD